jgi:hypothetical protein
MSGVEVWRRRYASMRAQRDDARAEVARLSAEAAARDELGRACPRARLGRRHAVRPAAAPGAAGRLWCATCGDYIGRPVFDEGLRA